MQNQQFVILKCKTCQREDSVEFMCEEVIFRYQNPRCPTKKTVHMDKHGFLWRGGHCYKCISSKTRLKRGRIPVEKSRGPSLIKGNWAENKAKEYFEKLGFSVEKGHGRGPDLFLKLGFLEYTVEVKSTSESSGGYRISPVTKRCKKSDLIIWVYPDGKLYLDDMEMHLKKTHKHGSRNVTKLYKFAHN